MPTPLIMPKFEMAQETGTISKWLKAEGDPVEKDEPVLEVETDKVNMEVEAPASGILGGVSAGPGAVVPIGQIIAYILKPGETAPQPSTPSSGERVTPVAERLAQAHGLDLQTVPRSTRQGRLTRADVETFLSQQPKASPQPVTGDTPGKVKAVPAARRLAQQLGVDLAQVTGSGPAGRIQSVDVRQAAASPTPAPPVEVAGQPALGRSVPLTSMRRVIAERLTAAARDVPQFTVSLEVDMSRAQQVIDDSRAISTTPRVTLTALLVKACAWALARHPGVNASFNEDSIQEWAEINVGVAVAVEAGLVVPVIHRAERLNLSEIAAQLETLSRSARDGKLRLDMLQGGTFTLSNLGMFGVEQFTAIINPPQAAILAVGRTVKRPVVDEADQLVVKPMAALTLTADHRVIDGAQAGQFLSDLKRVLERPGALV